MRTCLEDGEEPKEGSGRANAVSQREGDFRGVPRESLICLQRYMDGYVNI